MLMLTSSAPVFDVANARPDVVNARADVVNARTNVVWDELGKGTALAVPLSVNMNQGFSP
jgi:hypothetical protein